MESRDEREPVVSKKGEEGGKLPEGVPGELEQHETTDEINRQAVVAAAVDSLVELGWEWRDGSEGGQGLFPTTRFEELSDG